jgi:hypothetical protein
MEAKLQRYQGLEEKLDQLENMILALLAVPQLSPLATANPNTTERTTGLPQHPTPLSKTPKTTQRGKKLFLPNGDGTMFLVGYKETPKDRIQRMQQYPELYPKHLPSPPRLKPTHRDTLQITGEKTDKDYNKAVDPVTQSLQSNKTEQWRKVTKCGKRNADTHNIGDPKRSDVKGTPTRLTHSLSRRSMSLAPNYSKLTPVCNPYKQDTRLPVQNN